MKGFTESCWYTVNQMLPEKTFDFTRCVRPNGTAYGTAGKCRKGVERPEEERLEQDYEDRQFEYLLKKRYSDDPQKEAKVREQYKRNQELAEKIRREDDDGSVVVVSGPIAVVLKKRLNDLDDVSLVFTRSKSLVSFSANGEFDFGYIEDPKDRLKAALAVRHMFNLLTRSMKPGDLLHCSAYEGDGRGEKREKAYKKIGFTDDGEGDLVGEVQTGGGVAPPHSYSENQENLRDWYVALFGELPSRGSATPL